jgi:hypothetical protein
MALPADRWRCIYPLGIVPAEACEAIVFKMLGVLVALYVAYALTVGKVYARRGPWGVIWTRTEAPFWYWSTIVIYGVLSAALFFVF